MSSSSSLGICPELLSALRTTGPTLTVGNQTEVFVEHRCKLNFPSLTEMKSAIYHDTSNSNMASSAFINCPLRDPAGIATYIWVASAVSIYPLITNPPALCIVFDV